MQTLRHLSPTPWTVTSASFGATSRSVAAAALQGTWQSRSAGPCSTSSSAHSLCEIVTGRGRNVVIARAVQADAAQASVQQQQQQQQLPRYSPLHSNIEEFCARIVPTAEEKQQRYKVLEIIRSCAKRTFREVKRLEVEPFGSFVSGLSTWSSDIDVVVTGLVEPDRITGGFSRSDRFIVGKNLERLLGQLRRHEKLDIKQKALIKSARIPIIKLRTRNNITVDVCFADNSSIKAARYVSQQVKGHPSLKPLVLVLKVFLKMAGLHEVAHGGLSSYSLTNMVIAHLQSELAEGRDPFDLGETLYSFLLRFGEEFDYEYDAVSVASGGVVPKSTLGFAESRLFSSSSIHGGVPLYKRLCVEDPLTGRDIASGTYRIDMVQKAFQTAARNLEAKARAKRGLDNYVDYLDALFNVQKACNRATADEIPFAAADFTVVSRPQRLRTGTFGMDEDDILSEDDVLVEDDVIDDEFELGPPPRRRRR